MKNRLTPAGIAIFGVSAFVCSTSFAAPATAVNVLLQDPSTDSAIQSMRISVDRGTAPAGRITFRTINQSKDQIHELLVVRMRPGEATLPYDEKEQEVVEKRIDRRGEIDKLKPGASRAMTLNLKAGSYLLICNEPGHYKAGMSVPFSVTK